MKVHLPFSKTTSPYSLTRSTVNNRRQQSLFDYVPMAIVFGFLAFGVLIVYDASSAQALISFDDKFYFLKEQLKWIFVGLAAGGFMFFFDYRRLKNFALPSLLVVLLLLVAVFIPGVGVKAYGAHRWINLGFTVLQPSELAKLSLILYLSTWLSSQEKGRLISFVLLVATLVGLILLEPDMGTALVLLGTAFIIYFLSEKNVRGLIILGPIGIFGVIALAIRSPYRMKRIMTFFDPESDPLGASYHVRQALIALGSGGFFGLGLGNSRQKYSYLPEANTDSIFAIIGEELGFIGASIFIILMAYFLLRCLRNTIEIKDSFGRILGLGIIVWLSLQIIINISSMVALTPLTGVPLPLISYGGSALIVELVGLGILFNIWKQNQK